MTIERILVGVDDSEGFLAMASQEFFKLWFTCIKKSLAIAAVFGKIGMHGRGNDPHIRNPGMVFKIGIRKIPVCNRVIKIRT